MNKLIFGADDTQKIVNLTVKDDTLFLYTESDGVVSEERFEFKPWVLSPVKLRADSKRLEGDQHYKYLTTTTCDRFNDLQKTFHRDMWISRSIEECVTLLDGVTYYKGLKVADVSILSFDIETSGLVMNETSEVYLISNTYRNKGQIHRKLFNINEYPNQREMIIDWTDWVRKMNPSIICGHNILAYDLPYLKNCAGDLDLGRDGSAVQFSEKTSKFRKDGSQQYDYHNARITGREIVDTFFLSIKYDIKRDFPSYGLKPIVKHLGMEKADRTFIDASKIREYRKDPDMWKKVEAYAMDDSDDALKLFDLMIPAYFYLAQSIPKTLQQMVNEASGSYLDALMIRSYLQDGKSQPKTSGKADFEGAISMGKPGVYDWVVKADVASLYPSLMLEYNIHDKKKDPDNHMIQMLSYFRDERLANKAKAEETKQKYFEDMQEAQKILINSMYGFLGAGFLLYNYPEGAAEVTRQGRKVLLMGVEWATGRTLVKAVKEVTNKGKENEETSYEWVEGDKVCGGNGFDLVNVDTDSFSVTMGKKIQKEQFLDLLKELNALFPKLIEWKNDGIYEKLIVIGAKNYVMVKDGKLKYKGSAVTDQKKEPALLEMLKQMLDALLNDERAALPVIYRMYVRESMNIKDINRWVTKKTITKSVLDPDRLTEQKVLDAMNEVIDAGIQEGFQEGDKIWLYNSIAGEIQKTAKGEKVFYKDGRPNMIPNYVLKDIRLFDGQYDRLHYVSRVYSTVEILSSLVRLEDFTDFTLKKNAEALNLLTNHSDYDKVS